MLYLESRNGYDGVNPHTFDGLLMDFYMYQQMIAKFGIIASVCNMLTSCIKCAYLQSSIPRVYIYISIYTGYLWTLVVCLFTSNYIVHKPSLELIGISCLRLGIRCLWICMHTQRYIYIYIYT